MSSFETLLVWQKAHELTLKVYEITKLYPKEEIFGVTNQLRRASSSLFLQILLKEEKRKLFHID